MLVGTIGIYTEGNTMTYTLKITASYSDSDLVNFEYTLQAITKKKLTVNQLKTVCQNDVSRSHPTLKFEGFEILAVAK